jgi:hypothetical protein
MIKRHPELLQLDAALLANRVLQLRLLLPRTNISALIWQRPSLLLLEDAASAVPHALAQMRKLMPGIDFEARLHEPSTAYWSFVSLLPDARMRAPAFTAEVGATAIALAAAPRAGDAAPPPADQQLGASSQPQ